MIPTLLLTLLGVARRDLPDVAGQDLLGSVARDRSAGPRRPAARAPRSASARSRTGTGDGTGIPAADSPDPARCRAARSSTGGPRGRSRARPSAARACTGARAARGSPRSGRAPRSCPRYSTAVSSQSCSTTARLCEISTYASPRSRRSLAMSSRIRACTVTSSALVGSSRTSTRGSTESARAIATRWRWPPESWCGYRPRHLGVEADLGEQRGDARRRPLARGTILCARRGSAIVEPIRARGSSDVVGSWNTICTCAPVGAERCPMREPTTSCPSKRIAPDGRRDEPR